MWYMFLYVRVSGVNFVSKKYTRKMLYKGSGFEAHNFPLFPAFKGFALFDRSVIIIIVIHNAGVNKKI